jgi:hypothetical protein
MVKLVSLDSRLAQARVDCRRHCRAFVESEGYERWEGVFVSHPGPAPRLY